MKTKFFIYALTISMLPTYAMEYINLTPFFQKTSYQSLSNDNDSQLTLPKETLDKICAYCSHYNRRALQVTCKQFSRSASMNNLDKLIMHDFVIGNDKEKTAFFRAFIKTNNPQLITPLVQYATKEAEKYMRKTAIHQIDPAYYHYDTKHDMQMSYPDSLLYSTQAQFIQEVYLHPLLEEAIKQDSTTMVDRLSTENVNPDIIQAYYNNKCTPSKCLLCLLCSPLLCCCYLLENCLKKPNDADLLIAMGNK